MDEWADSSRRLLPLDEVLKANMADPLTLIGFGAKATKYAASSRALTTHPMCCVVVPSSTTSTVSTAGSDVNRKLAGTLFVMRSSEKLADPPALLLSCLKVSVSMSSHLTEVDVGTTQSVKSEFGTSVGVVSSFLYTDPSCSHAKPCAVTDNVLSTSCTASSSKLSDATSKENDPSIPIAVRKTISR